MKDRLLRKVEELADAQEEFGGLTISREMFKVPNLLLLIQVLRFNSEGKTLKFYISRTEFDYKDTFLYINIATQKVWNKLRDCDSVDSTWNDLQAFG